MGGALGRSKKTQAAYRETKKENIMRRYRALAYFALLLAVFIWGVNFLVVKGGIKAWSEQGFTFLAARFWLACIIYGLFLTARHRSLVKAFSLNVPMILQAALVGIILAAGYGFQTWYLKANSAINAAFLTSTTVLWSPFLARLFPRLFRQRVYITTFIGAVLAMIGIVLIEWRHISWQPDVTHWFALFAAIAFAIEILLVSRFVPKDKSIQWTTISCLTVASLMTILALFSEKWPTGQVAPRISSVIFTGLFATAVALGLQNWAQAQEINSVKIIDGPRAAIIAALEPVFTTFAVVVLILLGRQGEESLERLPIIGCSFILAGTLISEIAAAKRGQRQDEFEKPEGAITQT
jgi:drug/metabolite transporter (DMT)-like permease